MLTHPLNEFISTVLRELCYLRNNRSSSIRFLLAYRYLLQQSEWRILGFLAERDQKYQKNKVFY